MCAELAAVMAAQIAEHFRLYNEEFGRITRRAAGNFLAEDWRAAQADSVARIELYELRVARCVAVMSGQLKVRRTDVALWTETRGVFETLVARRADSDFYHTFFNSVTRDLFGTVGVNKQVEFCATTAGRACGSVPIRVYRVGGSLRTAVREILIDLPFGASLGDAESAAHRISAEIGRYFATGRSSGAPESIELIEPVFYRGMHAFVVGRVIGDGAITPLVLAFTILQSAVQVDAVMLSRAEVGSLFGYSHSYFHVDLPVVSAAITLLRSFMPRKSVDELYTVLGRAKQGKTERYFALQRQLGNSIDSFVHAPGERGLVMIVFTLPSHDLVFKVIRDKFGAPKTTTRADVIDRYQFVFRHDRAGRLVDAQEFKRLRLPRARFMPDLAGELLREAAESCRIEGEDLIVEHCYIERRLRPLNLFLREAEPAQAESAIIDYGNALRDLAASNVFPGDLLLKNFGVASHGRVIFYDYDEIGLLSDCVFRDLPRARNEEEEVSSEPWFHCGPRDVFPEQWLPFLCIPPALSEVFTRHHACLFTAGWWRAQAALAPEAIAILAAQSSNAA
ncbi:MAG TPA: bifunctional isocitrate dehydrogenase kinase/phosphatase [Steroidobacteraceae bacterium]|jgi:isocitrate dehydrogenase kinase/phosphatase|nr:bifunctional isocitrate dehydrogenase kinase/phosphatase [Steroidobacteraceae bacterium]